MMSRQSGRRALLAVPLMALMALVAGCPPGIPAQDRRGMLGTGASQVGDPPALEGGAEGPTRGGNEAARGALLILVRWPGYAVQTLPPSTTRLELRLLSGPGGQSLGTKTLLRGSEATASAQFQQLPLETLLLEADAFNAAAAKVAAAMASVPIKPSTVNRAVLDMVPTHLPVLTAFSPTIAGPGATVMLDGTFAPAEAPLSVAFGLVAVQDSLIQRFGTTQVAVPVPAGASTSPIVVTLDGVSVTSTASFVTVGSIVLSPQAATLSVGATASFAPEVRDTSGGAVSGAALEWSLANVVGGSSGGTGTPGLPPTGGGIGGLDSTGVFTASATGSATVVAKSGSVVGTASVIVE